MLIEYCFNKASERQIAEHLLLCEANFIPSLSERIDIEDYAKKIADQAARFEAWVGNVLIALIAAYCNDNKNPSAYITSVSVLKGWQGKGVASLLIQQCFEHIKLLGFDYVTLEVSNENISAIKLYEKHGFMISRTHGKSVFMQLNIRKGT